MMVKVMLTVQTAVFVNEDEVDQVVNNSRNIIKCRMDDMSRTTCGTIDSEIISISYSDNKKTNESIYGQRVIKPNLSLNQLARDVYDTYKNMGFVDIPFDMRRELLHLYEEVSEAARCAKTREPLLYFNKEGKPEGLGAELADVIIKTLNIMTSLKMNPEELLTVKNDYNATRPILHGEDTDGIIYATK